MEISQMMEGNAGIVGTIDAQKCKLTENHDRIFKEI